MKLAITLLSLAWLCLASSPSHAQKVERITMVGGPPSGVFGIFATGIGTYLSKNVPGLDVSVTATGGSVENTRRVNGGDAEMGLSFASDVHEAYHGLEQFKDKPLTNIRAIGLVVFGVAHLITFADSGIRTVNDLVGKRVAVGSPGSGTFANAERVFRTLGVWDKINRVPLLGAQAGEAMADGKADAFFWTGPEPDRVTMEAATKKPVRAIDIYTQVAKTEFFKRYPQLPLPLLQAVFRRHGTLAHEVLGDGRLGEDYGAGLTERELSYLTRHEWATTADAVLWRRTKCGLHMTEAQRQRVAQVVGR